MTQCDEENEKKARKAISFKLKLELFITPFACAMLSLLLWLILSHVSRLERKNSHLTSVDSRHIRSSNLIYGNCVECEDDNGSQFGHYFYVLFVRRDENGNEQEMRAPQSSCWSILTMEWILRDATERQAQINKINHFMASFCSQHTIESTQEWCEKCFINHIEQTTENVKTKIKFIVKDFFKTFHWIILMWAATQSSRTRLLDIISTLQCPLVMMQNIKNTKKCRSDHFVVWDEIKVLPLFFVLPHISSSQISNLDLHFEYSTSSCFIF